MTKNITYAFVLGIFVFILVFSFLGKNKVSKEISLPQESMSQDEPISTEPNPDSIPAMSEKEYLGSDLKLVQVLNENSFYKRYSITYKSEGLLISGILNIPTGDGPFPVLLLNHGYINPKVYTNGQGLKREQDYFARNGYAVLHSDYRGHAFSDPDPDEGVRPRSDYVEDVLNAAIAIKNSDIQSLNKENIGMLGHSMGGGVTENIMVTKPSVAKAFVLLAPINSDYRINFEKWVRSDSDFEGIAEKFFDRYGSYEENSEVWESFSAINYIDRISSPVMLHQGTDDKQVPVQWSRDFAAALENAGKNITYHEYPGEGHVFSAAQELVMQRTLDFFDKYLK